MRLAAMGSVRSSSASYIVLRCRCNNLVLGDLDLELGNWGVLWVCCRAGACGIFRRV